MQGNTYLIKAVELMVDARNFNLTRIKELQAENLLIDSQIAALGGVTNGIVSTPIKANPPLSDFRYGVEKLLSDGQEWKYADICTALKAKTRRQRNAISAKLSILVSSHQVLRPRYGIYRKAKRVIKPKITAPIISPTPVEEVKTTSGIGKPIDPDSMRQTVLRACPLGVNFKALDIMDHEKIREKAQQTWGDIPRSVQLNRIGVHLHHLYQSHYLTKIGPGTYRKG